MVIRSASWERRGRQGGLDLCLIMDTTGSMGTHLGEIRRHVLDLLGELRRHVRDVRCGAIAYKDHGDEGEDESYLTHSLPLTQGLDELVRFIRSPQLAVGEGGGGAEAVECALRAANKLAWRPHARRVVVLIGDKPPHGAGLDGFDCCPEHVDYREEIERLALRGVAVYTVRVGECLETRRVFEYMSARTGARSVQLTHVRDLPNSIISVCHREAGDLSAYQRRLERAGRLTDSCRELIHALT